MRLRIAHFSWARESCDTPRAQASFGCFVEICELVVDSLIQILSVRLALALWYSAWSKMSVLEVCSAYKAMLCLYTVTCNGDLPFSSLWMSCESKSPSLSVLISSTRRKDNTILFSLGGSVLVDLWTEMKSGSLYVEARYNASLLYHVSQQTKLCIRDIWWAQWKPSNYCPTVFMAHIIFTVLPGSTVLENMHCRCNLTVEIV